MSQARFAATEDPQTGLQRWLGLVESLSIAPPASAGSSSSMPGGQVASEKPRFDLQLATGFGFDPDLEAHQTQVHHRHRAFLHLHGGFRVQDPDLAATRYSIHYVDSVSRIGRAVFRVAVLPLDPTANAWVLDLDIETGYPLSRSEYTPQGDLISMLSVLSFSHGADAIAAIQAPNWWHSPQITDFDTPAAARAVMVEQDKIKLPLTPPSGFVLRSSSVIDDPLAGEQTLSLHYTDGIRSIVQLQTAGAPPLNLSILYTSGRDGQDVYAILDFSDLTTSQLMFQIDDVRYLILGSANTPSLDGFAEELLRNRVN